MQNDLHITAQFMLKGSNSSLAWRGPDGKLTDQSDHVNLQEYFDVPGNVLFSK